MYIGKSIRSPWFGALVFFGIIIAAALVFVVGVKIAVFVQPLVMWLAGLLLVVDIVFGAIAYFAKSRRDQAGKIIFLSSFLFGLSAWVYGLALALTLGGWWAVILGILLAGIGVIPVGFLAALFSFEWAAILLLGLNLVLAYATRVIGQKLMLKPAKNSRQTSRRMRDRNVIDIDPEDVS